MLCLLVFILFCGGIGFIFYEGLTRGDPVRLLAPLDANGKFCGVDEGLVDYKYLFFADIEGNEWVANSVCVKQCPT